MATTADTEHVTELQAILTGSPVPSHGITNV